MPVIINITADVYAIGKVKRKHTRRSPAVKHPCVSRISSVGIPYRREVGAVVVGAVLVVLEFEL